MNNEMAYLLGMVCGNGEIKRSTTDTVVSIDIPHKKEKTDSDEDVKLHIKASITDIRSVLEPLIDTGFSFIQNKASSVLSFRKPNTDYLMREILRFVGNASSHESVRISNDIFSFTRDQKLQFLRGFADTTGYIRRSNHYINKYLHRVYLEVPHNWELVADICNLLKDVNVPVQNINWGHPSCRDANFKYLNKGNPNAWKKEHQIKIFANEFLVVGFAISHKERALEQLARELTDTFTEAGRDARSTTHRFYWEVKSIRKEKLQDSRVNDDFIPESIRGKHYNSWKEIARDLGYGQ